MHKKFKITAILLRFERVKAKYEDSLFQSRNEAGTNFCRKKRKFLLEENPIICFAGDIRSCIVVKFFFIRLYTVPDQMG